MFDDEKMRFKGILVEDCCWCYNAKQKRKKLQSLPGTAATYNHGRNLCYWMHLLVDDFS